jgi:uncharacterized radical SAM superfamily protein
MPDLTPESIWKKDKSEILKLINTGVFTRKLKKVDFYAPSFTNYKNRHFHSSLNHFPTFSITGNACALNCKHCGSKVLKSMTATATPSKLYEAAKNLTNEGGLGCLISGGCSLDGSVPLKPFISSITRIKRELGLTVFVHTGILDYDTARELKKAGIEAALIDIIGSDRTIRRICNLDVATENYEQSLKAMNTVGLSFVPHVIVGLENGKLDGEFKALKMISKYTPSALVIIAFMPIPGTEMASVGPPEPGDIAKVVMTARLMFPGIKLALGCMRPKGKNRKETDVLALKAGVDAIAFPSQEAVEFAEEQGYELSFSPYCCAQIYQRATKDFEARAE